MSQYSHLYGSPTPQSVFTNVCWWYCFVQWKCSGTSKYD
jgi:hypothetical protein